MFAIHTWTVFGRDFLSWSGISKVEGSDEGFEAIFLLKSSFEDYKIFYLYLEEDSISISLIAVWNVRHFTVNFLGIGIHIQRQSCQNSDLFLLSRCETPIEITWLLSVNFSLTWLSLRETLRKKFIVLKVGKSKKKHLKLQLKKSALLQTLIYTNGHALSHTLLYMHFHIKMWTSNSCLSEHRNICALRTK